MGYDVTVNRAAYIGGSDIPIIMGISHFKSRFDLLLEKAGIQENNFEGNEYTEYGNELEPKIRDFVNNGKRKKFEPNRIYKDDIRCHTDGFNGDCVLEIKTTSQIHDDVSGYKIYLVQLLLYMQINSVKKGKLAVYERPADFNTTFDANRLTIYDIKLSDYKELVEDINNAIEQFRADLEKVKANPFITEQELQPTEIIEMTERIVDFENQLKALKEIEAQEKEMKKRLFDAMTSHNIKKWTTNNGVQITRVDGTQATEKIEDVFNLDKFKVEQSDIYKNYIEQKIKKSSGRSGYVKITLPQ